MVSEQQAKAEQSDQVHGRVPFVEFYGSSSPSAATAASRELEGWEAFQRVYSDLTPSGEIALPGFCIQQAENIYKAFGIRVECQGEHRFFRPNHRVGGFYIQKMIGFERRICFPFLGIAVWMLLELNIER
jgi:hypothetical protein